MYRRVICASDVAGIKHIDTAARRKRDTSRSMGVERIVSRIYEKQAAVAGLMKTLRAPSIEKAFTDFGIHGDATSHSP